MKDLSNYIEVQAFKVKFFLKLKLNHTMSFYT
jgi:hypothetical protein